MVDEILVHISTPATRQNDHLYRSLANAYLEFEPHTRYEDISQQEGNEGNSFVSTSKDSYGSFPSYIYPESQIDVPPHIGNTRPELSPGNGNATQTSSRLARLELIHMQWKKQATPRTSLVTEQRQQMRISHTPDDAGTAFIEDTQLAAQALQSQLQDSGSITSEDISEDEDEADEEAQLDEVPIYDTVQRRTSGGRLIPAQHTPTTASGHTSVATQRAPRRRRALDSSPLTTQTSAKKLRITDNKDSLIGVHDFDNLPLDAFPPAPKVSIKCPSSLPTQVTDQLAIIKEQNSRRFTPSRKHRELKPDDRGYWSIICSDWPVQIQSEFWSSLCAHVLKGDVGWGTSLHRDGSSPFTLGQVRLYCWAEVVEHTWLLLWLCSKGKVSGSPSRWIDGEGNVFFEMS
ncbi:hypothetical protein GQ44DRAFT_821179 [Phaeosphaeriaceae sp. PMI808]|nr:hypothetical protein GQ44DRAFT_821179 [Phaeosphaeriaceae sp. PMI808]